MHSARWERKPRELFSVKWNYFRIIGAVAACVTLITLLGAYALACSFVYLSPTLPSPQAMRSVEFQVPLRVYSRNGGLIAQIGEQRRIPATYEQIPELVKHAFLAAEDDRFFEHHGIDYLGVVRAVLVDTISGHKTQGASTITMQTARNVFLNLDKSVRRKLQETFVTYEMEHEFSKEEILGLYLNVIFLGQRAYGVTAAAETYFGKSLDELTVAEAATIAGLPKAPSQYNPIANPQLATAPAQLRAAPHARCWIHRRRDRGSGQQGADAGARAWALVRRGSALHRRDGAAAGASAIRRRGRERRVQGIHDHRRASAGGREPCGADRADRVRPSPWLSRDLLVMSMSARKDAPTSWTDWSMSTRRVGILSPAIVVSVAEKTVRVYAKSRGFAQIDWDGLSWARKAASGEAARSGAEGCERHRREGRCRLRDREQHRGGAAGADSGSAERPGVARSGGRRDRPPWSADSTTSRTSTTG